MVCSALRCCRIIIAGCCLYCRCSFSFEGYRQQQQRGDFGYAFYGNQHSLHHHYLFHRHLQCLRLSHQVRCKSFFSHRRPLYTASHPALWAFCRSSLGLINQTNASDTVQETGRWFYLQDAGLCISQHFNWRSGNLGWKSSSWLLPHSCLSVFS